MVVRSNENVKQSSKAMIMEVKGIHIGDAIAFDATASHHPSGALIFPFKRGYALYKLYDALIYTLSEAPQPFDVGLDFLNRR